MLLVLYLALVLCRDAPEVPSRYIVMFRRPEGTGLAGAEEARFYTANVEKSKRLFGKDDKVLASLGNGYIGELTHATMLRVEQDPAVAVVEKDQAVSILKDFRAAEVLLLDAGDETAPASDGILVQKGAPWGISRMSSRFHPAARRLSFRYPANAGRGTRVFVVDTGVDVAHPEFEGRARWGINLVESSPDTDENGHGTHCAGVIAGAQVGIAKKAEIVAVKALDKDGSGVVSKMILGLDFVIREHSKEQERMESALRRTLLRDSAVGGLARWKRMLAADLRRLDGSGVPDEAAEAVGMMESDLLRSLERYVGLRSARPRTIVNMSIGGIKSRALNFAMEYASNMGIHFSAAAGNDSEDACGYSPGSSKVALTVGASNRHDQVAFFSNYGDCVDVYAPGFDILSAWIGGGYRVASGTSMAAPHVSGVMALYLDESDYEPRELTDRIMEDAPRVIVDRYGGGRVAIDVSVFGLVISEEGAKLPLVTIEKLLSRMRRRHAARSARAVLVPTRPPPDLPSMKRQGGDVGRRRDDVAKTHMLHKKASPDTKRGAEGRGEQPSAEDTPRLSPAEVWKNASKIINTKKKEIEQARREELKRRSELTAVREQLERWAQRKRDEVERAGASMQEYRSAQVDNALRFYDDAPDTAGTTVPMSPFAAPDFFPRVRPCVFEHQDIYKKLDIDTLFYIFYTERNTVHQYFASKVLKNRSWRFHTKYNTWFQRLEEPKYITEDYEQGSYMFFDYDTTWTIRKKTDFTFEYKYLENTDM
ncbi:UNVERIFIED_CONTAM: hypothetical protein PYX00_011612 [Menopon gallinae]|uniref:Subtilisin n=1 Tax=Menopon gallinae TaxID=328185 RepID=A0AAW2H805_9NEOP